MAKKVPDEALAEELRQARKEARHFALVGKGIVPLKLLARRKALRDPDVMKAKVLAKAKEVWRGVVVGEGTELVFHVVGEEPTIQRIRLRNLITEQTGLNLKVRYEVVDELPEVVDEAPAEAEPAPVATASASPADGSQAAEPPADEVGQEPADEQDEPAAAPDEGPSEPTADPPDQAQREVLLVVHDVSPRVRRAVLAHPERREQILAPVQVFQRHYEAEEMDEARAALSAVESMLAGLPAARDVGHRADEGTTASEARIADDALETPDE